MQYQASLRERDFGTLSRQPIKFLKTESNRQKITIQKLITDHHGEDEHALRTRVIHAFETLVKDAQEKGYQSVLVVTHGGPLKAMTEYWIESGYQAIEGIQVAAVAHGNTAITRIDICDKQIIEFNSTKHLKKENQSQQPPPAV